MPGGLKMRTTGQQHQAWKRWVFDRGPDSATPGLVGSVQCRSSTMKSTGCRSASSRRIATSVSSVFCRCRCGDRLSGAYRDSGIGNESRGAKSGTDSSKGSRYWLSACASFSNFASGVSHGCQTARAVGTGQPEETVPCSARTPHSDIPSAYAARGRHAPSAFGPNDSSQCLHHP